MKTALDWYATRESTVPAIRYTGGDASFREIKNWMGNDIQKDNDGKVLFQSDGRVEELPVGNYLMCINGAFFSMTPKDFLNDYIRTVGD